MDGSYQQNSLNDVGSREHETLKYHLLGPSLTKAGQDQVDQKKVPCHLICTESCMASDVEIRSRKLSTMHLKAQSILTTRRQRTDPSPKKSRKLLVRNASWRKSILPTTFVGLMTILLSLSYREIYPRRLFTLTAMRSTPPLRNLIAQNSNTFLWLWVKGFLQPVTTKPGSMVAGVAWQDLWH